MSARAEREARIDLLEEAGRYEEATAELEALAQETGEDLRWHVAWMRTRAGDEQQAAELWSALRADHPRDPGVIYLEACALLEDERDALALPLLGEALALGLEVGSDATLLRRVADARIASLRRVRAAPEPVDHAARDVLGRQAALTPWFGAEEFTRACSSWPGFTDDHGDDHRAYLHGVELELRELATGITGRNPQLVELTAGEVDDWVAVHGWDPAWSVTHDQVAAEAAHAGGGRAAPWPPGRNDVCWCGSGVKYKRCCARA